MLGAILAIALAATSWQWQLDSPPRAPFLPVGTYDVDGFDTPAATVRALHAQGSTVVCYLSAGTWERWRPDARRFPHRVIGRPLTGWLGERWLDVRAFHGRLGTLLERRLDMCRRKGFDAVEADNVDGFENRTGFRLRARDQLAFNRWLAREAHRRGLAVLLKNDADQARTLEPRFDGALVEQCIQYRECGKYRPFARAGKPVFAVEYRRTCPRHPPPWLDLMLKRLRLDAWRKVCPAAAG
jgi:hypothetical protein